MGVRRIAVIGAGIGGLTAALDLAVKGCEVIVIEQAAAAGGKMREVAIGSARMDAGPTVFTMRWVFEEIFAAAGASFTDRVKLQKVDILARHAWNADQRLDLYADVTQSAAAIGVFAGAAEARRYLEFSTRAQRIYQTLEKPFLRSSRPSPLTLVQRAGLRGLGDMWRISPFATLWGALGEHFHDPRLRQLFGRYATYCGSSPFLAPATLMLIAHVERDGVWLIEGGMHRLAVALEQLAIERGTTFRYNATVSEIVVHRGRATGVKLASGEQIEADAVITNADVAALANGHLGTAVMPAVPRTAPGARSLSAITWNLVATTAGFPLIRHTVFFSDNYVAEFEDIFRHSRLPTAPTVYVCAQDRADTDRPLPSAPERLLCLVNAPPIGDIHNFTASEIAQCETQAFGLLQRCGLQIDRSPEMTVTTTPTDFNRLFPATGGALYGQASHGWQASFSRPGTRSKKIQRLYLAGGSVHPGAGVPMAALSGRLASASVIEDF